MTDSNLAPRSEKRDWALFRPDSKTVEEHKLVLAGQSARIILRRYEVDDDGTFEQEGNVAVTASIRGTDLTPRTAIETLRQNVTVTSGGIYYFDSHSTSAINPFIVTFFSQGHALREAPADFDWTKYSAVEQDFSVYRYDARPERDAEEVYRSLNVRHYLPFMDHRGRYWKIRATEPDRESGVGEAFASVLGALSRRSAIHPEIRPVALNWTGGSNVVFIFERRALGRCFSIHLTLPTSGEIRSGEFIPPGGMLKITDSAQLASGLLATMRERAATSLSMSGNECDCSE